MKKHDMIQEKELFEILKKWKGGLNWDSSSPFSASDFLQIPANYLNSLTSLPEERKNKLLNF